jgi:hypothetical protein
LRHFVLCARDKKLSVSLCVFRASTVLSAGVTRTESALMQELHLDAALEPTMSAVHACCSTYTSMG